MNTEYWVEFQTGGRGPWIACNNNPHRLIEDARWDKEQRELMKRGNNYRIVKRTYSEEVVK